VDGLARIAKGSGFKCCAVAAWLVLHASIAAAAQVAVHVEPRDEGVLIEATAILRADAGTAWSVLTDYDGYERFIPGVQSSRVLERRGARVTVRQSTEATLWLFRKPMTITYDIIEDAPHGLTSRVVAGCECVLESSYALVPAQDGVRLAYTGRFVATADLRGALETAAGQQQVARHLQALVDEIERKAAAQSAATRTVPTAR
jgi:hypothetical protein